MYRQTLCGFLVRLLVSVSCVAALAGCGREGPETADVTGTVTLDGTPVEGAIVGFQPAQGIPATATTDASGRFSLKAVVGQNAVTVIKSETIGGAAPQDSEATAGDVETRSLLPIKYSTTQGSGLSFDVQPGMAPVTIDLKS